MTNASDSGGSGGGRAVDLDPASVTRPVPELLVYYAIVSALTLVFFPLVFIPSWLKYRTLRYRFDEEGVSMSWGMLFQREIYLNYRRLQDIQMTQGVIQRRMGLASLQLHTASGSSGAEMTLEGLPSPEAFRDFLYARMEDAEGREAGLGPAASPGSGPPRRTDVNSEGSGAAASSDAEGTERVAVGGAGPGVDDDVALTLLREIRDELRALNRSSVGRET